MVDPRLVESIEKNLSYGYSLGDIKQKLLEAGWSEQEANEAISLATRGKPQPAAAPAPSAAQPAPQAAPQPAQPTQTAPAPTKEAPKKSPMKMLTIIMVVVVIVGGGGFFLFDFMSKGPRLTEKERIVESDINSLLGDVFSPLKLEAFKKTGEEMKFTYSSKTENDVSKIKDSLIESLTNKGYKIQASISSGQGTMTIGGKTKTTPATIGIEASSQNYELDLRIEKPNGEVKIEVLLKPPQKTEEPTDTEEEQEEETEEEETTEEETTETEEGTEEEGTTEGTGSTEEEEEQQEEEEEPAEIIDCGEDYDCFIEASEECKQSIMNVSETVDFFGILETATTYREIEGLEEGKCIFYIKTEEVDLEYSDELVQELLDSGYTQEEIDEEELDANIEADVTEGMDGTCEFETEDLTAMLERWKNLEQAVEDWDVAECEGDYFDFM